MKVKNMSFAYDTKTRDADGKLKNKILSDVSLELPKGEITTVLGANGCGKSTLFQLMTKNLSPLKGRVILEGKNIRHMGQKEFAKKVAIVHQYHQSPGDLTVERLVSYGRTPHRSMFQSGKQDQDIIEWAMEITGVLPYRNRSIMRLSGGQRQRVYCAMALAQKTDILFLDEPTTYLDIRYQVEILELIQKLNKELGITIMMVLHDINHALYYSDEIIGLKNGKVCVQGKPDDVICEDTIEELFGIRLQMFQQRQKAMVLPVR